MRRLISYNVFEGDPNLIAEGQILVIRDASVEGKILDIQQRVNSKMVSIMTEKVAFTIKATPTDATVTINNTNRDTVIVTKGSTVSWSVSKTGFTSQSGNQVVTVDSVKDVTLIAIED